MAVFLLATDLGARRRPALIAAAVVLFVPVTWFDSAIWSQVDSVGTLVLLLAVRELWQGRDERATLLTTVAAIIKPQFGILIPLAAVLIIRRNLVTRPPGHGPRRILTTTLEIENANAVAVLVLEGDTRWPTPLVESGVRTDPRAAGAWGQARSIRPDDEWRARCPLGAKPRLGRAPAPSFALPIQLAMGSLALPSPPPVRPAKKSLPLSSPTMNAGKSTTSIFQTASIPSS